MGTSKMRLMIQGQAVEVDDSFDQMSIEEQDKTINEIAASMGIKSAQTAEPTAAGTTAQMAAPAVTGAAYAAPSGMAKSGSDIANVAQAGLKNLAARPLMQTVGDIAGIATQGVPWGSIAKGAIDPASLKTGEMLGTAFNAAKAAPGYIAGMAGPAIRGAARVAGPAGMAYNVAEAYPYLQQANVGPRMQSGEVAQMAQGARQAQLSMPTPAPLSPAEAQNLLMSGDQRTINIYGGAEQLARTAGAAPKMAPPPMANQQSLDARIRAAAAKRALMMGQQGQ
jgi:hypothetical protein